MPDKHATTGLGLKRKLMLAIVGVIALLVIIIVFQNTETVRTRLLFMTIEMPGALLLLLTVIVGFAVGVVTTLALLSRRSANKGAA